MKNLIYIAIILISLDCCSSDNNSRGTQSNGGSGKDTTEVNDTISKDSLCNTILSLEHKVDSLDSLTQEFAGLEDSVKKLNSRNDSLLGENTLLKDTLEAAMRINKMNMQKDTLIDSLRQNNKTLSSAVKGLLSENDSLWNVISKINPSKTSFSWQEIWDSLKDYWILSSIILLVVVFVILILFRPFRKRVFRRFNHQTKDDSSQEERKENNPIKGPGYPVKDEKFNEKDKEIKKLKEDLEYTRTQLSEQRDEFLTTKDELTKTTSELTKTTSELTKTTSKLAQTTSELNRKKTELGRLEEAQRVFTDSLTLVPFAQAYTKKVEKLMQIVDSIVKQGIELLKNPLDDYYHVMKALARYAQRMQSLESLSFSLDVSMPAKARFAFNDSQLAQFDQNRDTNNLQSATMQYFFEKYLKTYINAAVVLNETLAGLHYLIPDLDASQCVIFDRLRSDLSNACDALEVKVVSVKIFEFVGQKIDLSVERIDAGIGQPGQILEINNCQVSLKGANTPLEKISVKVQS